MALIRTAHVPESNAAGPTSPTPDGQNIVLTVYNPESASRMLHRALTITTTASPSAVVPFPTGDIAVTPAPELTTCPSTFDAYGTPTAEAAYGTPYLPNQPDEKLSESILVRHNLSKNGTFLSTAKKPGNSNWKTTDFKPPSAVERKLRDETSAVLFVYFPPKSQLHLWRTFSLL
ncbi:hypothetical protein BV898_04075 [Hypsibius exemplaris]|uniref:Uncharacterized protein n=1 Tax=Hypsibius exemplaris TaxID=2072580 RepID=A0A1W0X355_HYPEX|nr:hypothetical protein BV898_04075 [Hypsibius exemplaris]